MENKYTIELEMKDHLIRKVSCLDIFNLLKPNCKVNGIQDNNPEITYTSGDNSVVVCENGEIKGVNKGITQITLDYHGEEEKVNIYVEYEIKNGQLV